MKKVLLFSVLFGFVCALSACNVGSFGPDRERLYGKNQISSICEDEPELCEDNTSEW